MSEFDYYREPSENVSTEPRGVQLMRQFCDLSDAIEREQRAAEERGAKLRAMSEECDTLRNQIGALLNPDAASQEAALKKAFAKGGITANGGHF